MAQLARGVVQQRTNRPESSEKRGQTSRAHASRLPRKDLNAWADAWAWNLFPVKAAAFGLNCGKRERGEWLRCPRSSFLKCSAPQHSRASASRPILTEVERLDHKTLACGT
jgi:hypothetical protein